MYFDEAIKVRLRIDELKRIDTAIKKTLDEDHIERWQNRSHFIRSAIIKLLNDLDLKNKNKRR